MAGRCNEKRFYISSEVIDSITDANFGCLGRGLGWLKCGLRCVFFFGGGGGWWFGANMAGQRSKNAFKFVLQLLIQSQKHILGV